jgi:hypothetical protein
VAAAVLVLFTETISWIVYRRSQGTPRSLLLEAFNAVKLGLIYGMFVEAFKIGS